MAMVYCRGCGQEIHESAPTCPKCGAIQEATKAPITNRTLVIAYIVAAIVPFAGFAGAIYLFVKGKVIHALALIVIAIVMMSFWAAFLPAFENGKQAANSSSDSGFATQCRSAIREFVNKTSNKFGLTNSPDSAIKQVCSCAESRISAALNKSSLDATDWKEHGDGSVQMVACMDEANQK